MPKGRLIRDIGFLLVGAVVIFGIVTVVNMFSNKSEYRSQDNFSAARKLADLSVKRRDWNNAISSNETLLEEDPFNGHAWFNKASAHYQQTFVLQQEYVSLVRSRNQGDDVEIDEAKAAFEESAQTAIDAFKICLDYARYRNRSRASISYMYLLLGQKTEAVDWLQQAVVDGYYNRKNGLRYFSELRSDERFAEIEKQELDNRNAVRKEFTLPQVFTTN